MKRVVSSCFNIRMNLGNFYHFEAVKQASEEIEYSSDEERIEIEKKLDSDLLQSLRESLTNAETMFAKNGASGFVQEVEDRMSKKIPSWLKSEPEPNIINMPEKRLIQVSAKQKDLLDNPPSDPLENITMVKEVEASVPKVDKNLNPEDVFDEEVFESKKEESKKEINTEVEEVKTETKFEKVEVQKKEDKKSSILSKDEDDLFDF
jgi:hypothetical protein